MEDVVALVLERRSSTPVVRDRALEELDARVVRDVLPLGREQVVDDERPAARRAASSSRTTLLPDEAGPADDEDVGVVHRCDRLVRRLDGLQVGERLLDPVLAVVARSRGATPSSSGVVISPVEVALGLGRVEQDRRRVVRVAGPHLDVAVAVELERLDGRVVELLDRVVGAGRDVVRAPTGPLRRLRLQDAVDQVVDEDEVASRVHDEDALAVGQAREERRQRAGDVARAVRVREPERDPVEVAERDVLLAAVFEIA